MLKAARKEIVEALVNLLNEGAVDTKMDLRGISRLIISALVFRYGVKWKDFKQVPGREYDWTTDKSGFSNSSPHYANCVGASANIVIALMNENGTINRDKEKQKIIVENILETLTRDYGLVFQKLNSNLPLLK